VRRHDAEPNFRAAVDMKLCRLNEKFVSASGSKRKHAGDRYQQSEHGGLADDFRDKPPMITINES